MPQTVKAISVLQLKRLLYDLYDKQPYTCVRIRLLGEMWQNDFWQIFKVDENAAIFYSETLRQLLKLSNISYVIQFEIDHNFQQYVAHFHYDVVPDADYT
jgi:hypothetical protein